MLRYRFRDSSHWIALAHARYVMFQMTAELVAGRIGRHLGNPAKMKRNRIRKRIDPSLLWNARLSRAEMDSLLKLAKSEDVSKRRLCVDYLEEIHSQIHRRFILEVADILVPDRSNKVRWATLSLIGFNYAGEEVELIGVKGWPIPVVIDGEPTIIWPEGEPEEVWTARDPECIWQFVVRWGSHKSKDIRAGVACCILEVILGNQFDPYFQRCKDVIEGGNRRFAYTLSNCWFDMFRGPRWRKFTRYIESLKRRGYSVRIPAKPTKK